MVSRGVVLAVVAVLACAATASAAGAVVDVTAKSFKKEVLKHPGVVMVEFYAPWCGHCKNLAPEWAKAASALEGVVKVVAVDATAEESLARKYSIQGFPTIKVFGKNKRSPTDYQGGRTADAIVEGGLKAARDLVNRRLGKKSGGSGGSRKGGSGGGSGGSKGNSKVVTLTDDNFSDVVYGSKNVVMVEFYAPWCGHCKNLAPEWEKAAGQLDGQVVLAAVDATVHTQLAGTFQVKGFPTIKVFRPGATGPGDAEDYQGGRTAGAINSYALKMNEQFGIVPEAHELTGTDVWEEHCSGKRICIVAFLPHILDSGADTRNKYLETMAKVVKAKAKLGFRFLWTASGSQPGMEKEMGLEFGFPTVVAINQAKELWSLHTGAFSPKGIASFCEGLMSGRVKSRPFDKLPEVVVAEPWDGKDGHLEVEEDDEDAALMAELMAEL